MDVLYIDVYLLLNFTIDILAAYFASRINRSKHSFKALILIGSIGAIFATILVFFDGYIVRTIFGIAYLALLFIINHNLSVAKRIKFIVAYFASSFFLGGAVTYLYGILDKHFEGVLGGLTEGTSNRSALIFALLILLMIGGLRIVIMLFSGNANGKSVEIRIIIGDQELNCEALLDSGNLAKDPMSMCPVVFIKEKLARSFLPPEIVDLSGIDLLDYSYKKRIRLIPITKGERTRVMTGVRVDRLLVKVEKKYVETEATVVIDKDEGDFGGYFALAPSVILE